MSKPDDFARRRLLLGGLAMTGGLGLASGGAPVGAAPSIAGQVVSIVGEAVAQLERIRRSLAAQNDIFVGDRISTRASTRAVFRLGEKTELRMGSQTRITIDRFMLAAGGTIALEDGALLLDKPPEAAPVTINSAHGLIAVRGTRIFAGPSNGVFGVLVLRGHVDVTAAGRTVTVAAGEGTDIAAPGAPPAAPAPWSRDRISQAIGLVS